MDVTISREARESFSILNISGSLPQASGFLLGHKRGHRFYIEKILNTGKDLSSLISRFYEVDRLCDGLIVGFFTSLPDQNTLNKVLAPFSCGMLLVKVIPQEKKPAIEAYMIDYEGEFILTPLPIK
ncbi:MAG: hypothetical protein JXB26_09390 [Candidatus Aminicenantes bacterium]|nr:hypothetical protein [Candidatus Aminicenantes bacterium]